MELDFITNNAIIYVLIVWVGVIAAAKVFKLQNHGFEVKPYSLTYKNTQVYDILIRVLGRTKRGIRVLADVSVVSGFLMMGFAFWFLINNIVNFFLVPTEFSELTVLIPGVTLTSASAIAYFLLSLPIVLIVHEGAHGIVAALEKIKIKTGGFAVFIALFAGFVEPDEEEFDKAKRISKLRVIGAGATANVIFALALGAILLTNPLFAIVLPEPILSTFYDVTNGVTVLSVIEGSGAESAGILINDIIIGIDDYTIRTPIDMQKIDLIPGDTNTISVLRGENTLQIPVEIIASPDDPDRGIVGIMRDGSLAFTPVFDYIAWDNHHLSLFLLWLWLISFFIGIINMLPLPILDGGKFIYSIIEKKMSDGMLKGVMFGIYAFTFLIFGLNIALSYIKSGWFTI